MLIHVLLYNADTDNEGIHSIEIQGKTVVLMFEDKDDAERYCGLLEAQDFPCPTSVNVERSEIESFCNQSGYEARFVSKGFIPKSHEDRLLISPPQTNLKVNNWESNSDTDKQYIENELPIDSEELKILKKNLENLL
tara:strand:- start:192 stop:602 length:411 start_codon:yes stop_codon:yes gene_type:complete